MSVECKDRMDCMQSFLASYVTELIWASMLFEIVKRQLVMMMLTIFALVSFRQIPLQLFGSCVEPLPLKSVVSFVACQEGKLVFGLSQ